MKVCVRNYRSGDFDRYSQICQDNGEFNREAERMSPRHLSEFIFSPRCTPDKDVLVSEAGGDIIGLCCLIPEPEIDRVILRGTVHPRYRRKGIGQGLLGPALKRAAELGVSVVQSDTDEKNESARRFLEACNFKKIRTLHEMRLLINERKIETSGPEDISIGRLKKGEESLLAEIQNLCFSGTWGYHPNNEIEVKYCLSLGKCSHDDVLLAEVKDITAGFCWLMIDKGASKSPGLNRGRIHMMGVSPGYRGAGIGKKLLMSALLSLKEKQVNIVELTVDGENKAAFDLYTSVGFKIYSNTYWYEKPL